MTLSKPTVLYVEDDSFSRTVVDVIFNAIMGITDLAIFDNSEELISRVLALPFVPNLILLDIQVKPHNGYEMIAMLRDTPVLVGATVVALTANVMATDIDALKNAGFDGLIGKPILDEIFPQLIENILNGESVWYIP